jgi:diguanylate cyclase (GGDEF)-like protein
MTTEVRLAAGSSTTPATLCLIAILSGQWFFVYHWLTFARLLAQPEAATVTSPSAVALINAVVAAACLIDATLIAWLWPRRHRPEPVPRASIVLAVTHTLAFLAMSLLFGAFTSPLTMVAVTALVVGLALLDMRAVMIGFLVSLAAVILYQGLVMLKLLPYAPALVPGTFVNGIPAPWWSSYRDYLFYTALITGVGLMLWQFNRMDRQRHALERLSHTDTLTGLANRRYFMERLQAETQRRDRYGRPYAVALCDADHFKRVNDTYGHNAGDAVLREIGRLLADVRRPPDVVARLGGEEFALLLPDTSQEGARIVCERLRTQLRAHEFNVDGHRFQVTISIGCVECAEGSGEEGLKQADRLLYEAKAAGRDRVVLGVMP